MVGINTCTMQGALNTVLTCREIFTPPICDTSFYVIIL
jgi:hypothetical protein